MFQLAFKNIWILGGLRRAYSQQKADQRLLPLHAERRDVLRPDVWRRCAQHLRQSLDLRAVDRECRPDVTKVKLRQIKDMLMER